MSVYALFKLVFAFLVLGKVLVDDLQELLAQIYRGGSVEWRIIKSYYPLSLLLQGRDSDADDVPLVIFEIVYSISIGSLLIHQTCG